MSIQASRQFLLVTFVCAAILFGLLPHPVLADDPYADSVGGSDGVDNPSEALGEPDSTEADFDEEDDWITLAMAPGEHGSGDLTIYYDTEQNLEIRVDIHDLIEGEVVENIPVTLDDDEDSIEVNVDTEEYNSLRITSLEDGAWGLDAIESNDTTEGTSADEGDDDEDGMPDDWEEEHDLDPDDEDDADEDDDDDGLTNLEEYEEDTNPQAADTDGDGTDDGEEVDEGTDPRDGQDAPGLDLDEGDLIKRSDNSAVYLVGEDGERHAFPNEAVYYSWFEDFDDVETVYPGTLSSFALGGNVTMRPGTRLVKIQSIATVYAVEPGGVLRAIPDEDTAEALYGADWAEQVADVADAFWGNYEVGDDLEDEHADGALLSGTDGTEYYIEDGAKREVDEDVFEEWRFQDDFVMDEDLLEDVDDLLDDYETGDDFGDSGDEDLKWAY